MAILINGNGNKPVTAQQDADLFQGIFGGSFDKVLNVGNKLAYTISDANTITVKDGELIDNEGRRLHIDAGDDDEFTIPTGESGVTNYYIIGYHIYTDSSANELAETFVQSVSSATATIDEECIRDGNTEKYVSLYRVTQVSLTITTVEALFKSATATADIGEVIDETLPFKFGIVNNKYGYYTTAGVFKSFRNPTGTAKAEQVLSGYTFSNSSSDGLSGSMVNRGAWTSDTTGKGNVIIPAGYHNGTGYVSGAGAYAAGQMDCTGTFVKAVAVGNYKTSITVDGLIVGRKYAFVISQYGSSESLTVECTSGADIGFSYQSSVYEDASGAPGILIGIATATSAVFQTSRHNGGNAIAAILLA